MGYKETYMMWLESNYIDQKTKEELLSLKENESEIEERFHQDLVFGTGGLRGIIGAGANRMNIYTVGKATQGLANYIKTQEKQGSVCIAYDSRHMSPEFAKYAAMVLCGNNIKTYVFASLRPTPELSFAVRELGCTAGIVITASHNPPEYNGYKAYWNDGAQVTYPKDNEIINEVKKVTDFNQINLANESEVLASGLYQVIGKELDDKYSAQVLNQIVNPNVVKELANSLSIVYTPLHGSGNIPVRRVLKEAGFNNVHIVKEQELPDPNFSTVGYPNPEDPKAFTLALKLAEKVNADLIIATDPDADRLGVVAKKDGQYTVLSGNMVGILLTEYMLSQKYQQKTLPENGAIVSTIVSSNMTKEICDNYHVSFIEVLTGFKYIGEQIKEYEENNKYHFLFGFEESNGYLSGTYARDKDGISASLLVCEMAAYYKSQNMSLFDGIEKLYKQYGYFKETSHSITLTGIEGTENIRKIMNHLRNHHPSHLYGSQVEEVRDYKVGIATDANKKTTAITLPASDVLYFTISDGSWCCIRPSGTEPKIKIYVGAKAENQDLVNRKTEGILKDMLVLIEDVK